MFTLTEESTVTEFPDAESLSRYVLDLVNDGFADRDTPYPLREGGEVTVTEDTVTVTDSRGGVVSVNRF